MTNIHNDASQFLRQSLQKSVSNNFGHYIVGDHINHGGFGHIFKLIQIKTKKLYALKVLDRAQKGSQQKIKNQINIHQSLKNRFILKLFNKFHDHQHYYMVLEYCQKGDLLTLMNKDFKYGMPIQYVQKFSQQIAKGISYLHKQDIVHGDIKPSNILINNQDQVKICDFGLSTKRKNGQKINGAKGTLNYLAPQCIFPYDQKVDIWSLGVLMYFMATGILPFQIKSYKQLTQILTEQKLRKLTYSQKINSKLKHLLRKIFVYDPNKRYSINDVLKHPFITGDDLQQTKHQIIQQKIQSQRLRSHGSTTLQDIKKINYIKVQTQIGKDTLRYHSKNSRPSSQYRNIDTNQLKQNYMGKILQKKSKLFQKNNNQNDKQNNMNIQNTKNRIKNSQMKRPISAINRQKQQQIQTQRIFIQPLNTQNIIIKPILQKNYITKIDLQGICRRKQQIDQDNNKSIKQIKISPNGKAIFMKINNIQKFYTLQNLPSKYHKQYQNCRKVLEFAKNHTPKIKYQKKYCNPKKEISLILMYNGKLIAMINDYKLETTQKQLKQFKISQKKALKQMANQQNLKNQIKILYQKLINL